MSDLFKKKNDLFDNESIQRGSREGIELEKGVVLNEGYMREHFEELGNLFSIFTAYPDL